MSNVGFKIGVNASFLRKPDSGIGQVTFYFIKKLGELQKRNSRFKIILYLEEDFDAAYFQTNFNLPVNFEKKVLVNRFYKRDDLVRKIIWEKCLLPRAVKKDGCDLLFSLYQSTTVTTTPHIMLVHDTVWKIFPEYLNNWRKRVYYWLVDQAIKKTDKILTVSENSKRDAIKYFKLVPEKIQTAWIDCDEIYKKKVKKERLNKVLRKYGLNEKEKYIFYVGGFDARKNLTGLFEAYGKLFRIMLKEEIPNLVLAGKFNAHLTPLVTDLPRKIKETAKEYIFSKDKIKQIGFVEQADLPALYSGAELFCYPSLYEGFGMPPLEAQNIGCPLIVLRNSSLRELFDNKGAIMIDENNPEKIAQAMKKILVNQEVKNELVQAGRENAGKFSWESFVGHFWQMAEELVFSKK